MILRRIPGLAGLLLTMLVLTACERDNPPAAENLAMTMKFSNMANGQPLQTGTAFTNAAGETITPQAFKYYLSNFSMVNTAGQEIAARPAYALVDHAIESSKTVGFIIAPGVYNELRFWIGVDSLRNVSGVQDGALDPVHGMFWTWNSGYIFAKFEGRSPQSTAPLQAVTYHIGGFRTGENALRQVAFRFQPPEGQQAMHFELEADAAKWFHGAHTISVATEPRTEMPGPLAIKIADNYAEMFTLKAVQ